MENKEQLLAQKAELEARIAALEEAETQSQNDVDAEQIEQLKNIIAEGELRVNDIKKQLEIVQNQTKSW